MTRAILLLAFLTACDRAPRKVETPASTTTAPPTEFPPVAVNAVSPIEYPADLLNQQIEGRVLLRLYVDSVGTLVPDSSRIAESSGHPTLDSAALAGARDLKFSPALHRGRPIAVSFLQPVLFRPPRARGATP